MPNLIVNCPHCQGSMQIEDRLQGSRVVCPHCRQVMATTPAPALAPGGTVLPAVGKVRPTPVTVFGILSLIFGGMGVLCTPLSLILVLFLPNRMGFSPSYKVWMGLSSVVGVACGVWLVINGIGLLKLKKWAHRSSIIYGWSAIVLALVNSAISLTLLATGVLRLPGEAVPGFIGGTIGGLIGLVFPILLLVFMNRDHVRAAFREPD